MFHEHLISTSDFEAAEANLKSSPEMARRERERYYWLLLAESHLTRRLFGAIVGRIAALPAASG